MNERVPQLVRVKVEDAKPGEIDEAERLLRATIEHDDTRTDAVFELAMIRYAKGSLGEALELISKAIDIEPTHPKAYYHRAMIRFAQGDLREALVDFDTELQRTPDDVDALLSRAVTLAKLGDQDRALGEYERVMQLAPEDPRPYFNRALLRSESNPEDAIRDYSEAIRRDAGKADAYLGRGFVLRAKGRKREALADFTAFARIGGPQLHTVKGWIQQLRAEVELPESPASQPAPSETPLSDLISLVLADPSSSQALAAFHQAVLKSMVGVIAVGAPPGHVGEYQSAGDIQLVNTQAPDGRLMLLACADRAAFVRKFHQRFNAEMRGRELLSMVLKLPACEGVLLNSAASFHSILIPREDIPRLLNIQVQGPASHEGERHEQEDRADRTENPERPRSGRPWWKFW